MKIKKKILIQATVLIMALSLPLTTVAHAEDKEARATATPVAVNEENFPDANFRSYVSSSFDKDRNGSLSETEINLVTEISLNYGNVSSLEGVQYFAALTKLYCVSNQLTELDLSKNTALTELTCGDNQLTELDVSKNTALTELYCGINQLTELDVSKNTALTRLECNNNSITTLDVSKNTTLTRLACGDNQLTEIDVSKRTALISLLCADNQLTTIDVSNNTELNTLWCDNNQLTEIDVSKNTKLTQLKCSDIQLATIDVSNNTELNILECDNNQLTEIDVSKNTKLSYLDCGSNQLTELDFSNNTELGSLICVNNQLTTLDVSNITTLTSLDCRTNNLVSLQLAGAIHSIFTSNQGTKDIYLDYASGDKFDLSTLDSKIDGSKISNLPSGVTINGTLLSGLQKGTQVQYTYDCGAGQSLDVIIAVKGIYPVVVNNGTESRDYKEGETVTIKADEPAIGKQFKEWQIVSGSITLANPKKATTIFTMPGTDVEVTAVYEDATYPVVVNGGTRSDNHKMNDVVNIKANAPAIGKQFKEWQVIFGNITLDNSKSATTTFTMPASNVEITAVYEDVTITSSDSTYQIGSGKNLTYKCSSLLEDFVGIYMDNELIDTSHYTLKSGSTIVTLESSYLDTLTAGKHTIRFEYKDGVIAETELTIKAKEAEIKLEDKPNTPTKPEIKPDDKPNDITTPEDKTNTPSDEVKTGDETNIAVLTTLFVMTGLIVVVLKRKHDKN